MSREYDVIVVGVGGMGSATVFELAKRGRRVLGLDRFAVPNDRGSSHGVNRIIRLAYHEGESYVPLLRRAYQLWSELEQLSGERLLHRTGSIDAGEENSDVFAGSLESCRTHGLEHEVLSAAETGRRFPGYRLPAGYRALLQPDGGFLMSELCIAAYAAAARDSGAEIHAGEGVEGWEPTDGDAVEVTTARGRYRAAALVITAGAWNAQLVPRLEGLALPERQALAWFQPHEPALFTPERFPVFNADFEEGCYYGFPAFGVPGFKIGRYHHLDEPVEPDELSREVTAADERVLRAAVSRYFPAADGELLEMKTCMFTNSPDDHFLVGQVEGAPQVSFAAGFSGHGFKFCSVIGEIMADLATAGSTRHPIADFDPDRFKSPASPAP